MKALTKAGYAVACIATLTSCAEQRIDNAPPAVVADCRREADELTKPDPWLVRNDPLRKSGSEHDETIEDARSAEAEVEREGLAGWPREVLVYRCLLGQGVVLTPEQTEKLAEWQRRLPKQE